MLALCFLLFSLPESINQAKPWDVLSNSFLLSKLVLLMLPDMGFMETWLQRVKNTVGWGLSGMIMQEQRCSWSIGNLYLSNLCLPRCGVKAIACWSWPLMCTLFKSFWLRYIFVFWIRALHASHFVNTNHWWCWKVIWSYNFQLVHWSVFHVLKLEIFQPCFFILHG